MAENLGSLVVKISADLNELNKGLNEANNKVQSTADKIGASTKRIGLTVLAVSTTIVTAFAAMIKSTVDYGDKIFEVSQRTGIAVETLSKLKFVAEQTESSFEAVTTSLRFLNRNLFEAQQGNKDLTIAFASLGIAVTDSSGKIRKAEDVFLDVADAFTKLKSDAEKTALAMQVFGRGGAQIIPILNLGKQGIEELSAEAEKLGLVLTAENAKDIDKFSDDLKKLHAAFSGLTIAVSKAFIPALTEMVNFIKNNVAPVLEGLDALLFNTANKLTTNQVASALGGTIDPVLNNARIELVRLQAERDRLTKSAATSGGRGTGGQEAEIANIEAQEKRTMDLIKSRMDLVREESVELEKISVVKDLAQQKEEANALKNREALIAGFNQVKQFADAVINLGNQIQGSFSNALSSFILGAGKARDIVKELGTNLVKAIVDFVAQQLVAHTIGKALAAIELVLIKTYASAVGQAWAVPAALAATATFGGAAAAGSAALATSVAFSKGLAATGLATGTDTVPAMLSPGEMVVPRSFADAIRGGDLTLGGREAGNISNNNSNVNITVNAVVDNSVDIRQLAEELAFHTQRELRYVR